MQPNENLHEENLIKLGHHIAEQGTKVQGYIKIADDVPSVPYSLINGDLPGKKILITAGIHGNEYPGILATAELVAELDPLKLAGSLTILHLVNIGAFYQRLPALCPADGKNINRVYPGKADGTASEKIAHFITSLMGEGYDFYLDLHSGDMHEDLIPHLYYSDLAKPEVIEASHEAAKHLGVHCFVRSQSKVGSIGAAALHDLPALLIERGGRCIWCDEDEFGYKSDLYRLLKYWGMYDDGVERQPVPHIHEFRTSRAITAGKMGLWKPLVKPGDYIQKGQVVGLITNVFGNIRETVHAVESGTSLYQLSALSVRAGDDLIYCGVEQTCTSEHHENHDDHFHSAED